MSSVVSNVLARHRRPFVRSVVALTTAVVAFTACSSDQLLTSDSGGGSSASGPHTAPARDGRPPTPYIHFAFWFNAPQPNDALVPYLGGSGISTVRIDIGHYVSDVSFMSDLFHPGSKEIVMSTTYGETTAQCVTDVWFGTFSHDNLETRIDCIDQLTGQRADANHAILVVGNNVMGGRSAFAIANQPTAASYVPDTAASYTSTGGAMQIQRIGAGDWYVNLGTGNPQGSMYLVNSFDEHAVCTVAEWKNFGIRVRCFDRTGAMVDTRFKVLQAGFGREMVPFAFAWVDQRSLTTPYTPVRSLTTRGGPIIATRTSVGDYQVAFDSFQNTLNDPDNVQVTPFSGAYSACTVVSKTNSATARLVRVQCRDSHGRLADSRFNIIITH
jgi:hypothetical protein